MAFRRRGVRTEVPPHLSDVLQRLSETGRRFIELYEIEEERMQDIASKLVGISDNLKEIQTEVNITRVIGAAGGGLGIVVGVAAAFLAGGLLGEERAATMAALGCGAALAGSASVIGLNLIKAEEEKQSIESVGKLGREFMEIIELLKDVLENIKEVSEELEERSSSLKTKTGEQARRGLSNTNQLPKLLNQTAKLADRSRRVMDATLTTQRGVWELICFVTQITPTPDRDAKFRNCITASALQCKKVVDEFAKMKKMLEDFEEMQTE